MTSRDRVRSATDPRVNRSIRKLTERRLERLRGDPEAIRSRLHELDAEWDVERALGLSSTALTLFGLAGSLGRGSRGLALPIAVQAFYLQHVLQGWCPPLPLLRRLGFRTQREIERERYTLRAVLREHADWGPSERPAERPAAPRGDD
jgi:hypothetical protein